ncbi:MAG TPA: hypothetical protein VII58_06075 [Acidobacteriaceae bacterium]
MSFGIPFLTIDNLDGHGAVDYSAAISADSPFTVERTLNAPSRCTGTLVIAASVNPGGVPPLPVPGRRARVVVASATGAPLFTGYIATEPESIYAGAGLAGPVYRIGFTAISDEWLLDKLSLVLTNSGYAAMGGTQLAQLANRTGGGLLTTSGVVVDRPAGVFTPEPAKPWSINAGLIAGGTYIAYRALGGALSSQAIGDTTHTLDFDTDDGVGSGASPLSFSALKTASVKELANDVTVVGLEEPSAYVQEIFAGDGATTVFHLSSLPFHISKPTLLTDSFNQRVFNKQLWSASDPGSRLSLGGNGFTLAGGNGFDGQTTLTAIDQFEIGGTLVLEAAAVQLNSPSDGVLLGLYPGPVQRSNCFAGYNVRQSGGATLLTPFVNGAEIGASFTVLPGHSYTLCIRIHSPEVQRVLQTYYAMVDGAVESFGSGAVDAPVSLVFDLVDLGNASNTPATVLYDSAAVTPIAASPAVCTFALADSVQLFGSIGSCTVSQTGSAWAVSTPPSGALQTRLIGAAGKGLDCQIDATGKVTFYTGRVPVPGERITIFYRTRDRAVARLEDQASIAAEASAGFPGTARWIGKVQHPPARSTADCEAAAQALLVLATSRANAISGSYAAINPVADIWPGDVLAINANGETLSVVVRKVTIVDGHSAPQTLTYKIVFANDWAEALGIQLSESIPADTYLPTAAATAPGVGLTNLQQLTVISATPTALTLDAGTDPPSGGGFEVRLRDFDFGPGPGADLVLRSPVRGFIIPRAAQLERYFIRMYDASTPPNYSALSAAIFTDLPVS